MEISTVRPDNGLRAGAAAPVASRDLVAQLGIERRAWFDLNGDGRIQNTSPLTGGDAYLVGDRDGDGRVATGLETWYDRKGRPVPPPVNLTAPIASLPVHDAPHAELTAAANAYSRFAE